MTLLRGGVEGIPAARAAHRRDGLGAWTISRLTLVGLATLVLGGLANLAAYESMEPVLAGALVLAPAMALLHLRGVGGRPERQAFLLVFAICWVWAGVAAALANSGQDPSQTGGSDAAHFFDLASGTRVSGLGLQAISAITEGAGAVVAWRALYDAFASLGFERARYIGVTLNILLVAFSAVAGIRMVRRIWGPDGARIRRFTWAFALCGMFWMYAAIHNRDAAVLLAVSLLVLVWARCLDDPGIRSILGAAVATVAALLLFGYLRVEFAFVPVGVLVAGLAAAAVGSRAGRTRRRLLALALVAVPVTVYLVASVQSDMVSALRAGRESYAAASLAQAEPGSLGIRLIANQPPPIRLALGSAYLALAPIPVWAGIRSGSAYHLFKSLHAVFVYLVAPMALLAVWRAGRSRELRPPPVLFLILLTAGFALSVAYTSGESRHLGAFGVPMLVLAMLPDLSAAPDRRAYRRLLACGIGGMVLVHLAWAALKFA